MSSTNNKRSLLLKKTSASATSSTNDSVNNNVNNSNISIRNVDLSNASNNNIRNSSNISNQKSDNSSATTTTTPSLSSSSSSRESIGLRLYNRSFNLKPVLSKSTKTTISDHFPSVGIVKQSTSTVGINIDDINIDDNELEMILQKHENEKKEKLKELKYNTKQYPQIDLQAAKTWIYPTNLPERTYQFKICEKVLLVNTLVCLPTGLGKTFIASVVMYNFHRWFPTGKIIFLAHTISLVDQQMNACYNIMGIPEDETVVLTGRISPEERVDLWKTKRVFFCTPECVEKDLETGSCPARQVVLVVFDEAHKASGNHAYCVVTKLIGKKNDHWRVLGLSATPGKTHADIQKVITNLRISHVEVRDESDRDVAEYLHEKETRTIICNRDRASVIIDNLFYQLVGPFVERLIGIGAVYQCEPSSLSKNALHVSMKKFLATKRKDGFKYMGDFKVLIALYTGLFYLHTQDMTLFVDSLNSLLTDTTDNKKKDFIQSRNQITKQPIFKTILQAAEKIVNEGYVHPKLKKLEEVILEHFQQQSIQDTRVVVFAGYRKTVDIIVEILSKHDILKVSPFIGQSKGKGQKGFNQKKQKSIIQDFRDGVFNVLVATQIGEEGLDIGEIDLIVLYDSVCSPTRLIQRVGRTGRKRKGNIIVLLSEGRERYAYDESVKQKKVLFDALKELPYHNDVKFFDKNMRMIPNEIIPTVVRENITVQSPFLQKSSVPKLKKRKRIIESDDEDDGELQILSDKNDDGADEQIIEVSEEEVEEIDDNFTLGGEEIHESLVDYSKLDTISDDYQTIASAPEATLKPSISASRRKVIEDDNDYNFDITKYRNEMKEKSKDSFKTNGHMDLDKILKLSQRNLESNNPTQRRMESISSLIFANVSPPKWSSTTTSSTTAGIHQNDDELLLNDDDDDIIIDFSLEDIQSSSSPPNKSIPSNFGSKKVKLNDFYD